MNPEPDLTALLLRVALGLMIALHGANKVWGAGGLAGTTGWFRSLGLSAAALHARMAAVTELAVGVLLVAGLLTPLACAGLVGLMVVAARTDHRGKGFFVFKGGWEYVCLVAVAAVALTATGAGRWSLDELLLDGWGGPGWALAAAVLGVVAGLGLLLACYRPQAPEPSGPGH